MKPFIQNVSFQDIVNNFFPNPGFNSMLIQIVDPCMQFPESTHQFREIHQFEFLDLEEKDAWGHEFKITKEQATEIVRLLQHAYANEMNVIVHCVAGVCRSGAVCEVGTMLGFRDMEVFRAPNLMVKKFLMRELGWTYEDEDCVYTESGLKLMDCGGWYGG